MVRSPTKRGDPDFTVHIPSWRLDVEREIDVVEEIARLHGYDKFANTLPAYAGAVVEPPDAAKDNNSISAIVNANVATAYTLFTRQAVDSSSATSAHVEFLIDRQGYLRARWIGVPDAAADRIAKMPSQIELLNRERPHAPLSERHAH